MIKINKFIEITIFCLIFFYTEVQLASEILLYADDIHYDSQENIVAKGNVKIINEDQIITSDIVIYNKKDEIYILPKDFNFNDGNSNYYNGSSGQFTKDLSGAEINDLKLLLNDGSRIVGKKSIRKNHIDIITKGTYSPCSSRIRIKEFICPIWQLEGEKILHDSENLFLYQKHSKMRLFNIPVFYIPYIVTPSPLRKERKSGFLGPKLKFNFLDTKVSQSTSFPYYLNLAIDKELTFTPVIKYGGGVNSSQRLIFDYNQKLSGGLLGIDLSFDTKLENKNNEEWLNNASVISKYEENINEEFKLKIEAAFQTSPSYLRTSDPNNLLSYATSLKTSLDLDGFKIFKPNDRLNFNISSYQVVKRNEDNKTTPTALPFISYDTGYSNYNQYKYKNQYSYYNIFRDISTSDHAQSQNKISHSFEIINQKYAYKSDIKFKFKLTEQYFKVTNKKINLVSKNNDYFRFFPMSGIFIETPLKHKISELLITPKLSFVINSGQSNSNKISNEESTNNAYDIVTHSYLNRYSGTDKLDNSKRINYGINIIKNKIEFNISQYYEFEKNSNYHKEMGNKDYLSDILSNISYTSDENRLTYALRHDEHNSKIKNQQLTITTKNFLGKTNFSYLDEKKENNSILETGTETIKFKFKSAKFNNYSEVHYDVLYDLVTNNENEYTVGYSYFDECFGINFDFTRKFYTDRELKPNDSLLLMFSFKNLGSYQSSNIAVSEFDKQDIEWITKSVDNELFN